MHIDPYIALGSAVVGLLVGMTGAGGGALMTPMLILLFGVKAPSAISSDLVAAVLMRPVGAAVHMRKGTVNYRLVGWLMLGSVPMAFLGAYLLHLLGGSSSAPTHVEQALGAALLTGAAAMVIRYVLDLRGGKDRQAALRDLVVRPVPTVVIGMVGGVIVGLTSVGSGSLMIVLLLFLYPMISAGRLVGTDLTQAVPLTLAAALGALAFGHVEFAVTLSIIIGSVPAVLVGSLLSSTGAGQVHPARHHLRDPRLRPQVRRPRHHRARLDLRRHPDPGRRHLARHRAPPPRPGGCGGGRRRAGPAAGADCLRPAAAGTGRLPASSRRT